MTHRRPTARRWLLLGLKLLVVAALAWFIRDTLVKAWEQIARRQWRFDAGWLAVSGGLYAMGLLPAGWYWWRVLRALGQDARLGETLRAYCIGHLGKYVPGKAMVVLLRAGLVRSQRVHMGVAAASVFFETLTMMAVGSFLAGGVLAWRMATEDFALAEDHNPHLLFWGLIAMMAVSGLPTVPPLFRRLSRRAGVGRSDPETAAKLSGLGYRVLGLGWLAMALAWVILGASLWATFRAMGIEVALFAHLPDYTAVVALALVAGFLSMIPAGFGVRDVLLVALNVKFFGAFGVDEGTAALSAALLRVVWLVAELVISGILYAAVRERKPGVP